MRTKIGGLIFAFLCASTVISPAQDRHKISPVPGENVPQSSSSNAADLKTDLERMQVLLGQMQRNVAFVSAGDTPMKHQFELEIEMWQLLIRDIEKKTQNDESIHEH